VHERPTHAIHDQMLRIHEAVLLLLPLHLDTRRHVHRRYNSTQTAAPGGANVLLLLLLVLLVCADAVRPSGAMVLPLVSPTRCRCCCCCC
jgi:hypothetical protein